MITIITDIIPSPKNSSATSNLSHVHFHRNLSHLSQAVRYNNIGCTTALVEAHASPNCVDYNEETVVHYAARLNLSEHLAAISRGANPASLDSQNKVIIGAFNKSLFQHITTTHLSRLT